MYSKSEIKLIFQGMDQTIERCHLASNFEQYLNSVVDYHKFVTETWENINITLEEGTAMLPEHISEETLIQVKVRLEIYFPKAGEEATGRFLGSYYVAQLNGSYCSRAEACAGLNDMKNDQSVNLRFIDSESQKAERKTLNL